MIHRIVLTTKMVVLCGLLQHVFAQINYQPGYVVLPAGDTVKGFIDYRNWDKNPERIAFRDKAEGPSQEYGVADIRAFSVAGEVYASAVVKVEASPTKVGELSYNAEFVLRSESVFLRTLISGSRSLYLYNDPGSKRHFYIFQDGKFELLLYKRYLRTGETGSKIITESKTFIGQLKIYLNDCEAVGKKLPGASYDRPSLEKLFAAYGECTGTKAEFKNKMDRQRAEFGILAGATLTTLSLQADAKQILMETSYPQSINFTGGIFYDKPLQRNLGKWSWNNELIYTSYKTENTYTYAYVDDTRYQYYETQFKYAHLKLNTMLRFKYPAGKVLLYANVGLSLGWEIQGENSRRYTNKLGSTLRVEEDDAFKNTDKFEFGYLGGGGVKIGKYSAEVRYAKTGGMVSAVGIGSSVQRISFVLGYRLR